MDEFFSYQNLAQLASATGTWLWASVVFLSRNPDILKMISIFVSVLLLVGIIHSIKRGLRETKNLRTINFKDALGLSSLSRPRSLRAWRKIEERLKTKEEGQIKLAVIEADRLFDHLLVLTGYRGENFAARFQQLTPSQFSNIKELGESHAIAERLLNEPALEITYEGAEKIIKSYGKAFEEAGMIEV